MKTFAFAALPFALALAACGSTDDASTPAEADTVEMTADEAMVGVTEEPAADPSANAAADAAAEPTDAPSAAATTDVGANAADVAARAQEAAAAAEAATETPPQN